MKWLLTVVPVTVLIGATTGASASNSSLRAQSFVVGVVPNAAGSTGWGLVDSVTLSASTGAVTVTTRAVVATADLVVNVIVMTAFNLGD